MHFDDLSPCRYGSDEFDAANWRAPLLAVGWLEHPHPFTRGAAPRYLAAHVRALALASDFMGVHGCSLCTARGLDAKIETSPSNLFVPGNGVVYLAPGGIEHYIEVHSYLPPRSFVEAVFACPPLGSPDYRVDFRLATARDDAALWPPPDAYTLDSALSLPQGTHSRLRFITSLLRRDSELVLPDCRHYVARGRRTDKLAVIAAVQATRQPDPALALMPPLLGDRSPIGHWPLAGDWAPPSDFRICDWAASALARSVEGLVFTNHEHVSVRDREIEAIRRVIGKP